MHFDNGQLPLGTQAAAPTVLETAQLPAPTGITPLLSVAYVFVDKQPISCIYSHTSVGLNVGQLARTISATPLVNASGSAVDKVKAKLREFVPSADTETVLGLEV